MKIAVRIVVILLALAGAAGHLAYLDALWWHTLDLTETMARDVSGATAVLLAAHAAVSITCSILGVWLVLHEGRRSEAARALALSFGAWSYLMAYSGATMLLRPPVPGLAREVFEAHFLLVEVLGLAALLRFTSMFPRALTDEELKPLDTLPAALLPFHNLSLLMSRPAAPWVAAGATLSLLWSWTLASGGHLSDAGLSRPMDIVRFSAAGLVTMNLHRAWRVSTEGDRDALMWLAAAFAILVGSLAILIGGNVLVAVTGFPEPNVAWKPIILDVGTTGFFAAVALSILHKGHRDPAHLTQQVATATLVATSGLFLAAGLEALFTGGVFASYSPRAGVGTALAFAIVVSTYSNSARMVERVLPL